MKDNRSKQSWLTLALQQLIKKGPSALTIDRLCEVKKVTKGSFYHHFKGRKGFIEALIAYWYEKATMALIEQADKGQTPLEKLQNLDKAIAGTDAEAESHLRAWALQEPLVAQYLALIDQKRTEYLQQCYQEMGCEAAQARDIALMVYSSFLGMQQIHPKPDVLTTLRVCSMGSRAILNIQEY